MYLISSHVLVLICQLNLFASPPVAAAALWHREAVSVVSVECVELAVSLTLPASELWELKSEQHRGGRE